MCFFNHTLWRGGHDGRGFRAMSVSIKAARFGIAMIVGIGLLVVLRSKSAGTVGDGSRTGGGFGLGFVPGDAGMMTTKKDGTSTGSPPMSRLLWDVDAKVADRICTRNRRYAEKSGSWVKGSTFMEATETARREGRRVTFHDSVSGLALFRVPGGNGNGARTWPEFILESKHHGWPSFRDDEVVHENVRVLPGGETVSITGTHLGHNLPAGKGNRYCVNLVCVAGRAADL